MSPAIARLVLMCQNRDGGFGGNIGMPSSILSTVAALQLLFVMFKAEKEETGREKRKKKEKKKQSVGQMRPADKDSSSREGVVEKFMERFRDDFETEGCEDFDAINYAVCNVYLDALVDAKGVDGNEFGEKDQRFVCCYVASKKLIAMLNPSLGGVSFISEEKRSYSQVHCGLHERRRRNWPRPRRRVPCSIHVLCGERTFPSGEDRDG